MAINYLNTVNLNKNSLDNARIQNLATEPTADTPGQVYFNTVSQTLRITEQTGFVVGSETYAWVSVSGDITSLIAGTDIDIVNETGPTPTINHADITRADTADADAPGYGGTFATIDSITTSATGHVTAVNVKTITLPASDDTTYDLTSAANATAGVDIVLTGSDSSTDTVNIIGTANEVAIAQTATANKLQIGLPTDVTISNDLTVSNDLIAEGELSVSNTSEFTGLVTASAGVAITTGTLSAGASTTIDLGANRVTNIADPTAAQDAATKSYVDTAVIGLLEYQGGYNAATNTPALDTNLAISSVGSGGGAISGTFNATTTVGTGSNMTIYVETNANGNIIVARVVNGGSGYTTSSVVSVAGEISGHTGSYFGVQAVPIANIEKGWTYTVTDSGYFYNEKVEPGDVLIAELNAASGQEYWTVVQNNVELASAIQVGIGNAVANPATNRKGISVAYANPTNGTALVGLDILGITTDSATTYAATDYSIPFYSATAVENYKITMAGLASVVSAATSATGTIAAGATTGTVAHDFGINTMVQTFDTGSGETVFCDIVRDTNSPYSVTATIVGAQTNDITILVQKIG